jgi:hypothetical protein
MIGAPFLPRDDAALFINEWLKNPKPRFPQNSP